MVRQTTRPVFGSHWWRCSIGECDRLSQPSWLVVSTIIII